MFFKSCPQLFVFFFLFCIGPQDIASSLKNCTKTFSKCRKYEDEAITIISACRTNPTELKQKVKLWLVNGLCNKEIASMAHTSGIL